MLYRYKHARDPLGCPTHLEELEEVHPHFGMFFLTSPGWNLHFRFDPRLRPNHNGTGSLER